MCRPMYLFSAVIVRATGARTSVRWKDGKRRCFEISKARSALAVFLRYKSRGRAESPHEGVGTINLAALCNTPVLGWALQSRRYENL